MLNSLTSYLLQYKKVAIPSIGSLEIKHIPARLDFADRLIHPPSAEIIYSVNDEVGEHQLVYLQEVNKWQLGDVKSQLLSLGQQLNENLLHSPIEWKGIGKLEKEGNAIHFQSSFQNNLKPVAAHKVIRENVSHTITIGDREMQSHEAKEIQETAPAKSSLMLIVWLLIITALLIIVYLFYTKGLSPLSTGSQQQVGVLSSWPSGMANVLG